MFPSWYADAEKLYIVEKMPYYKIGKILGVCRKSISYYLRKGGYESNQKYARNVDPSKLRKYTLDETVFDVIDNEEKAYWLGFIYADGAISELNNSIEVGLKYDDYSHIEKLQMFFKTNHPIYSKIKYNKLYDKQYKGYRLFITNKKIKDSLINLGCVQRKSNILSFPDENMVPINLLSHFVRGYFDGDGHVGFRENKSSISANVEILGSKMFLIGLINWTGFNDINIHGFNHSQSTYRILVRGNKAKEILDKIYKDASIYLERKYKVYNSLCLPSVLETK